MQSEEGGDSAKRGTLRLYFYLLLLFPGPKESRSWCVCAHHVPRSSFDLLREATCGETCCPS